MRCRSSAGTYLAPNLLRLSPMSPGDTRVRVLRLRVGMAVVAAFHVLFGSVRYLTAPEDDQHLALRLLIIAGTLACVGFTYLRTADRLIRQATLLGGTLLLVTSAWLAAAQGMVIEYTLGPTILFFAVSGIAASSGEIIASALTGALAPVAFTLAYGWHTARTPLIPLLLFLCATVGGAMVSWFRLRSQAVLTREIARREEVEFQLRAARAHLESILHATSDGLLGVQYAAGGPRITFANRRFGEIFGFDPPSVVGQSDDEVRAQAAESFRHPEEFERGVRRLYERRDEIQTTELELVRPRHAVLERWSGPIRDPHGVVAGRIWSFRDVTTQRAMAREREEYAARLESANAELARASQAKDAFLANLSHELRTPLSVIIGYQNLVLEGGLTPQECTEFLRRSTASATHLLRLISDMLDLTRLEAGSAEITVEPLPVTSILHEVRDLTQVLANAKGLRLELAAAPETRVLADRQRLKQILLNLIGNGLKFTSEGGVTISAAASNGKVRFAVRDTGRGISPEQQGLLFRKFMRLDTTTTAPDEGVGLGLSICRQLVTLMGGEIELESAGLGKGTEVRFSLPRAD